MLVTGASAFSPGAKTPRALELGGGCEWWGGARGRARVSDGEEAGARPVFLSDPIHPYSWEKCKGTGLGQLPGADLDTELLGGVRRNEGNRLV